MHIILSFKKSIFWCVLFALPFSLQGRYAALRNKDERFNELHNALVASTAPLRTNSLDFLKEYTHMPSKLFRAYDSSCAYQHYVQDAQKRMEDVLRVESYVPFSFPIRVLLDEQLLEYKSWILQTDGYFDCYVQDEHRYETMQKKELSVRLTPQGLFVDGRYVGKTVLLKATKGYIKFDQYEYPGVFIITCKDNKAYLVNQLDIEDYLYCVVRWESWPGWPLEVNKAFAIACRSYVMAKVLEANKKNTLYHIKNSNLHQTYNGIHAYDSLRQAIYETRGLVLTYNKKPIEAMFDCCCGGVIPANITAVNLKNAPYLARKQLCTFCSTSKIYRWQLRYSKAEMQQLLESAGYYVGVLRDITIARADKAGYVQMVSVRGSKKTLTLTGRQMYGAMSKIKSFVYAIEKKVRPL